MIFLFGYALAVFAVFVNRLPEPKIQATRRASYYGRTSDEMAEYLEGQIDRHN